MARLKSFGFFLLAFLIFAWIINAYIVVKTKAKIFSKPESLPLVEAVIVPGASVYRSGRLSPVLKQRMDGAIAYLATHPGPKLILSGHAIPHGYNETGPMVEYARRAGLPLEKMIVDEKGRSTYVTLLNSRRNYPFRKILIVSQEFHLPRALYIAQSFGFEASGLIVAEGEGTMPTREYFVRFKDFILVRISKYFHANVSPS